MIEYFKLTPNNKNIVVDFSGNVAKKYKDIEEFQMSILKKKLYSKLQMMQDICRKNNVLLNHDEAYGKKFIKRYCNIKLSIDSDIFTGEAYSDFIDSTLSILFDKKFFDVADSYINENYKLEINKKLDKLFENNKNKKRPPEITTFHDVHYKIIHVAANMSRIIIPLITHFVKSNNEINSDDFINEFFVGLHKLIKVRYNVNLYDKIYMYLKNYINSSKYSDKELWEKLQIHNINPEQSLHNTLYLLITNIIPKFDIDGDVMNYMDVTIRQTIFNFTLRRNMDVTFYSMNDIIDVSKTENDDSVIKDTEMFDSYNIKHNETHIIIRKHFIDDTIEKIRERLDIPPLDEREYNWYKRNLALHNIQTQFILNSFAMYFSGTENMYAMNKSRYIRLMMILNAYLRKIDINNLPHFICGKHLGHSYMRISKSLLNALSNDNRYISLMEDKYRYIRKFVEKNDFIKKLIVDIVNNMYEYNEYKNKNNGSKIKISEIEIMHDVLNYFTEVIK